MTYAILLMISAVLGVSKGSLTCDSTFAAMFSPPMTELIAYEVCTTPEPLGTLARSGWQIQALPAPDAFGVAGSYDRPALARLYRGLRPTVARGWLQVDGHLESLTLISPYPNRTLTQLVPGTLLVRATIRPKEAP